MITFKIVNIDDSKLEIVYAITNEEPIKEFSYVVHLPTIVNNIKFGTCLIMSPEFYDFDQFATWAYSIPALIDYLKTEHMIERIFMTRIEMPVLGYGYMSLFYEDTNFPVFQYDSYNLPYQEADFSKFKPEKHETHFDLNYVSCKNWR